METAGVSIDFEFQKSFDKVPHLRLLAQGKCHDPGAKGALKTGNRTQRRGSFLLFFFLYGT